jgi:uncharacterized protein YjbI with pentapeptide repeats
VGRKKPGRKVEPKRRITWPRWSGFSGMTVRDWLPIVGALLIPVVIAAGTWWITWQQGKIEDQRAQAERDLVNRQAQDAALQAYLNQMTELILDRKLLEAQEGDAVYTLAKARTSTAIVSLDAEHNRSLTSFLAQSGLMGTTDEGSSISLLSGVDLREADLREAYLRNADLSGTDLSNADLSGANLNSADLSVTFLRGADLSGAFMPDADLSYADLSGADLSGAFLPGADLSDTEGISNEELDQPAAYLKGTTMPNGQKYEEWLKSKGSGESSGPS